MTFRCEDLAEYGLILIPPSSPDYEPMLADIRRRLDNPVAGGPPPLDSRLRPAIADADRETSAIFVNRGEKPAMAFCWIWKHQYGNEPARPRSIQTIGTGSFPSVLLPFGLDDKRRAWQLYWHGVLPGSKRYLGGSQMVGDNSDVRPPAGDEIWVGGIISGGGGGGSRGLPAPQAVTLTLDGVFFADGEFAGPNTGLLWERITGCADAAMQVARIAQKGHFDGTPASRVFAEIQQVIGNGSWDDIRGMGAESARSFELRMIAMNVGNLRRSLGDERAILTLAEWASTELPKFRRK